MVAGGRGAICEQGEGSLLGRWRNTDRGLTGRMVGVSRGEEGRASYAEAASEAEERWEGSGLP